MPFMWWFRASRGGFLMLVCACVCVCLFMHTEICSPQLGLCSHGDGCERLWESNLQEVIAAGWSICGMRMAPEGRDVDVQLAICRRPVARARKPPRNHTGWTAFSNARARDSARFPRELLGTSQTLSFGHSQLDFQKNIPRPERWLRVVHLSVCRMRPLEWKLPQHGLLIGQRSLLFLISGQVLRPLHSAPNREPITKPHHKRPVHKARGDLLAFRCWCDATVRDISVLLLALLYCKMLGGLLGFFLVKQMGWCDRARGLCLSFKWSNIKKRYSRTPGLKFPILKVPQSLSVR